VLATALIAALVGVVACAGKSQTGSGATTAQTTETTDVDGGLSPNVAEESMMATSDAEGAYWSEPYDPIPYNTEEYNSLQEAGFVSPRINPLSTLSADVDTASYCNLRRMLYDGYVAASSLPDLASGDDADEGGDDYYYDDWYYYDNQVIPTGAVRIEEMLNYFSYDYATPSARSADLFATTVHVAPCPWNSNTVLLTLGFATAPEAASVGEKGSNLVFLIDISGSMDAPDKLDLLKRAFAELVAHLDANDRVSIVTYASGEDVVLEGASGNESRQILSAINRLQANGSTNGEAGLRMAYEVAQRNFIEGGVNRIVLASDGDLNVGMSSESELHDYVDQQRETGIYLSVLGFGSGNYKDNKMETLADHGNGSYHYIDCVEEAERVLGGNLMANLVPLADDVKVQVEFNPALVKGYRLIGYENRAMADEDFTNDERDAGDVGPGAQFTVAYEVALADSAQEVVEPELHYGGGDSSAAASESSANEWLTAQIRYQPVDGGAVRQQSVVVGPDDVESTPAEDWRFQAAVIELGMLLRGSDYAGTADYEQIASLVGDTANLPDERAEFLSLAGMAL
jgi:Ca-activated chloride channel family protein